MSAAVDRLTRSWHVSVAQSGNDFRFPVRDEQRQQFRGVFRLIGRRRVGQQVYADPLAVARIVGASGELDKPTPRKPRPVARMTVAQAAAPTPGEYNPPPTPAR